MQRLSVMGTGHLDSRMRPAERQKGDDTERSVRLNSDGIRNSPALHAVLRIQG